jgi:hypothetical protein
MRTNLEGSIDNLHLYQVEPMWYSLLVFKVLIFIQKENNWFLVWKMHWELSKKPIKF